MGEQGWVCCPRLGVREVHVRGTEGAWSWLSSRCSHLAILGGLDVSSDGFVSMEMQGGVNFFTSMYLQTLLLTTDEKFGEEQTTQLNSGTQKRHGQSNEEQHCGDLP